MPWLLRISHCTWFSKMVSSWQRSFFPSLPGLVLNDVQQLNWEWNHQFDEISDVMVGSKKERKKVNYASTGQLTFYCSSTPWHTPPLRLQMIPLLLSLSILERKTFKTVTRHRSPPTLPCSRKPSSFSKSEANILQPSSSSPPVQSNSPSQTWFFEMQLPSRQENSSCFGLKIWNIAQQMIVSY